MKNVNQEKNNNYSIVIIILFISIILLTGYNIYSNDKISKRIDKIEEKIEKEEKEVIEEKTDNNTVDDKKETSPEEPKKEEKEYVGYYKTTDGDPNTAYIKLNDDMTFERNVNMCEGYVTSTGTYTVEKNENDTIIVIPTEDANSSISFLTIGYKFKYKDNMLFLIDKTNSYAYYDCANSRTFKKQ